jgi:peptidoglycan/LPS O-acetylase OafA/YrhL
MAAAVTWAAFGRLAWAMGVSWVMFACITGYGGIINSFLSWSLFSPLSKLTYCTYLIHIDVIFLFFYNTKRPMYFSEYTIVSFLLLIFTYYLLTYLLTYFNHIVLTECIDFMGKMLIRPKILL